MSTTYVPRFAEWEAAVDQALATLTVEVVKVEKPTLDTISPRARERQADRVGSWERGVRTSWSLRVTVLGFEIDELDFYPLTLTRYATRKAAAAYDVAGPLRDALLDISDSFGTLYFAQDIPEFEQALLALVVPA